MWKLIAFTAVAGLVLLGAALGSGSRKDLARTVAEKFDLPDDDGSWMIAGHREPLWGCWLGLVLFVTGVVAFVWLGVWQGVIGTAVAFPAGWMIAGAATRLRGNVSPALSHFAAEARQRAIALERAGDLSSAQRERALADLLSALTARFPHLPRSRFEEYRTPFQVACIIEARFSGDSDQWELDQWLATPDDPLDDSPSEARRVAVLMSARNIMKSIDQKSPETPEQRTRVMELIDELKKTPPAV